MSRKEELPTSWPSLNPRSQADRQGLAQTIPIIGWYHSNDDMLMRGVFLGAALLPFASPGATWQTYSKVPANLFPGRLFPPLHSTSPTFTHFHSEIIFPGLQARATSGVLILLVWHFTVLNCFEVLWTLAHTAFFALVPTLPPLLPPAPITLAVSLTLSRGQGCKQDFKEKHNAPSWVPTPPRKWAPHFRPHTAHCCSLSHKTRLWTAWRRRPWLIHFCFLCLNRATSS